MKFYFDICYSLFIILRFYLPVLDLEPFFSL